MMKVNEESFLELLKEMGYEPELQKETNQIYCLVKHDKREYPLFIRFVHEGDLIQLLTFIPCSVKAEHNGDVSRFLHIVNKELDVPGFCLDEISTTVFYRLMVPTSKKEIQKDILEALLNTSKTVCTTFSPAIEAMAMGMMSLEDVLKKAKEAGIPTPQA